MFGIECVLVLIASRIKFYISVCRYIIIHLLVVLLLMLSLSKGKHGSNNNFLFFYRKITLQLAYIGLYYVIS